MKIEMKVVNFSFGFQNESDCYLVAVLSTTIISEDGTYEVTTLGDPSKVLGQIALLNLPHYVGHPATRLILEQKGNCSPAPTKLFPGLKAGTAYLCFPIKQGQSDRSQGGSAVNQEVTIDNLDCKVVVRVK
jgi:hypothetical protein